MKTFTRVGVLSILTVLPSSLSAQLPSGYVRDSAVYLPDSLLESSRSGRFHISIARNASNQRERELLAIAESLIPPKEAIEAAGSRLTGGGHVQAFAQAKLRPGARWWWREWDYFWLPYALTSSAIAEYMESIRRLSVSPNPFTAGNPGIEHRATLKYTADVRSLPNGAGHQAELAVTVDFYCGRRCALSFTHTRRVTFDGEGRVTKIEGDQPTAYRVS